MKKNIQNRIWSYLALIAIALLTYTCAEEVKSPCDDNADLKIKITGKLIAECGGSQVAEPTSNADILVTHYNSLTNRIDTLLKSKMNNEGYIDLIIPNSGCGISNLKVKGVYKSFEFGDSLEFMCCDTTLNMELNRTCDEISDFEVSCSDLDRTINLNLTNSYGGCILFGSPSSEIKWNSVAIVAKNRIQVNVNNLTNLSGKYSATFSPTPDGSGNVDLAVGSSLTVTFLIATDEIGEFSQQIQLPVTCLDGNESGTITINLDAEICDDGCVCPFNTSGNTEFNVNESSDGILVGTTQQYDNKFLFAVDDNMLSNGCYMQVTSIQRYPDNSISAMSIASSHEGVYDWMITSPTSFPEKLQLNDIFTISGAFTPEKSGLSVDTFEVFTDVYNQVGALKDQCSFRVVMTGRGCVNVCPSITISSFAPAELLSSSNTFIRDLKFGETLDMDSGDKIKQKMNGTLGSLCAGMSALPEKVLYNLKLNIPASEEICSDLKVVLSVLQDGAVDDRSFFGLSDYNLSLSASSTEKVIASFYTPSISTHLISKHASMYYARVIAQVVNDLGTVICQQEIKLEAEVHETAIQISEPRLMKSFSQVSDKDGTPAYQAYDIAYYNETYNYFGKVDNLSPVLGHINVNATPYQPNTPHSFFFDVDEPNNKILRQEPKLYLVNNSENLYKQVTQYPVAYYADNDAFKSDMQNLVQMVFKKGNFNSLNTIPVRSFTFSAADSDLMWSPSKNASEMNTWGSGIPLEVGGVYIIWAPVDNPFQNINTGVDSYTNYCNVAFLYIDAVSDGAGTNHHIGTVSFYVAYPLSIVKN